MDAVGFCVAEMNSLLVTLVFSGAAARCGRGQSVLVAPLSKAPWWSCRGGPEMLLPLFGFKKTWTKVENVPGHPGAAWHLGQSLAGEHPSPPLGLEGLTGMVKVT